MSWEILNSEDVLSEFTLSEAAAIRQLQGSGSGSGLPFANIDVITARTIDEVRGYIVAGNYDVDPVLDNTLPTSLFADAIAIARWRLLIATPSFRQLQTDERRKSYEDALKKLGLISDQKFNVEPPNGSDIIVTGNWNSENKLIMRGHPIPPPSAQFPSTSDEWANAGPQPPVQVAGALYDASIVALRNDPHSLEALASTRFATDTLLLIVIDNTWSTWRFVVGAADPLNPDGEVAPLDYDSGINNRHWEKAGGL